MVHLWFIACRICAQGNPSKSNKCKLLQSRKPVSPRAVSLKNHGTTMVTLRCYEFFMWLVVEKRSFDWVVVKPFIMGVVGLCVVSALGIDISNQSHADALRNDHVIVYSITSVNFILDIPSRNLLTNSHHCHQKRF